MNHFHIWCSLKAGVGEREFAADAQQFLADLHAHELCEGFLISRREFATAPPALGRFQITVEFLSLAQLLRAFAFAEEQEGELSSPYANLLHAVSSVTTALYRDYPESPRRKLLSITE
jgi:hypothetical protein